MAFLRCHLYSWIELPSVEAPIAVWCRTGLDPENSQIMPDLTCLLIPQQILPQALVISDTRLLREFPGEINILRDIRANL